MLKPPSPLTSVSLPRVALAAALTATLIGCGGGGGGEEGKAPLSFGAVTPASLSFDIPQGVNTPWVILSAPVGGDTSVLQGQTLFVRVDDPLGLFEGGTVGWDSASSRATLSLSGRTQEQPGTRSGRVTLRVCLDAACQQRLNTNELGFDISVKVRAGLRVDSTNLALTAPFGTAPTPQLVRVMAPEGRDATDFRFGLLPPASGTPPIAVDLALQADGAGTGVLVTPRMLPVGRYEHRLWIEAATDQGTPQAARYGVEVPIVVEVTPSAVDFAVSPTALALQIEHGRTAILPFSIATVAQGGHLSLIDKVYDNRDAPPGAEASAPYNQWLQTPPSQWHVFGCVGSDCLPRGLYRATLRYGRFDERGFATGQVVDVPVSLEVR